MTLRLFTKNIVQKGAVQLVFPFFRLVDQALAIDPVPYKTLIKPNHNI